MSKIIITIFFFFLVINSFSQPWFITRGLSTDEVAWAIDADSTGNIYWAVEEKDQWPYWYYNIILFKIDSTSQQVWQSNSWGNGTGFNDIAFKATVKAPYVFLSGRTDSTGNPISGDALVACFNIDDGSFNWAYCYNPVPDYGYDEIDGLIVKPDGIYLSGWKQQKSANDMDFLIQKINFSGQLIWTNTWDYNFLGKFDGANGHMVMDNDFLYVAGHVNRNSIASLDGEATLVCFSRNNGTYQWNVTWGGSLYDDALGMAMSSDSMLYITGCTGSFGNGSQNYLNKYTRTGQLLWNRIWGGEGTEDSRSLVTDGDSIIYVIGATSSYGKGLKDIFVLKYNSSGILIDSLTWGGAYDETAKDVVMYREYLYITGETKSYGNGLNSGDHKTDGLLLKINGRKMEAPGNSPVGFISQMSDEGNAFEIYPNPTDGYFRLSLVDGQLLKDYQLIILDVTGRIIEKDKIITNSQQIDCRNLNNGLYFLLLKKNNIVIGQKKIIKQSF